MAEIKDQEFSVRDKIVEGAEPLARLLDLRLVSRSQVESGAEEMRWPLGKAILFTGGISIVLWAAIFAIVRFLLAL